MNNTESSQDSIREAADNLRKAMDGLEDTADNEKPSEVAELRGIGVEGTTLVLRWKAAFDNIGIAGYEIFQDGGLLDTVTDTYYRVSGLESNKDYEFQVAAVDLFGNKSEGVSVKVTTAAPDGGIRQPSNITATTTGTTTVQLKWSPSSDTADQEISYRVFVNAKKFATVTKPEVTLTGMQEGKEYEIHIVAADAAGNTSLPGVFRFTHTVEIIPPDTSSARDELKKLVQEAETEYVPALDKYTKETVKEFKNALDEANEALKDDGASEETLQGAYQKLYQAMINLKLIDNDEEIPDDNNGDEKPDNNNEGEKPDNNGNGGNGNIGGGNNSANGSHNGNQSGKPNQDSNGSTVKTGDSATIPAAAGTALISLAAITFILLKRRLSGR